MVAFLQALPEMSEQRYRELAMNVRADDAGPASADRLGPSTEALEPVLADCNRCHGADDGGRGDGAVPRLAGQSEAYLLGTLQAYASGKRHSGIMQPVAAGLESQVLSELAKHYAELPAPAKSDESTASPAAVARGQKLAERGLPARGIASCIHCHGPSSSPRNPMYPRIAGQQARFLQQQLELFVSGTRGGSEYAQVMHIVAKKLTREQIRDLAVYYASLPQEAALMATEPTVPTQRKR